MIRVAAVLFLVGALYSPADAMNSGTSGCGGGGGCDSCHPARKGDFVSLFRKIDPGVKVVEVSHSPVRGLYQVTVDTGGKKGLIYVDFGKRHIVSGNIVSLSSKSNLTSIDTEAANARNVGSDISTANALISGNPQGTVSIYVLTDPDCPYCGKLHASLKELVRSMPQLRIVLLLTPLPLHPQARMKSEVILGRARIDMNGAVRMLEQVYEKGSVGSGPRDAKGIAENIELARKLGVKTVPAIILPSGQMVDGTRSAADLKRLIQGAQRSDKRVGEGR